MFVILDTTETHDSLRLDSANFKLLKNFIFTMPATLVVPKIVVEETVNHYRERLVKAVKVSSSSLKDLQQLIPQAKGVNAPNIDISYAVDDFEKELQKVLSSFAADQPDYDNIEVGTLVKRALSRRKPFDDEGKSGFRDAVLWESIVHLLTGKADKAVLITRNSRDFGPHEQLAKELQDDLIQSGLASDSIVVCHGLSQFVDDYIKPHLAKLGAIEQELQKHGKYKSFEPEGFFAEWFPDIQWELSGKIKTLTPQEVSTKMSEDWHDFRLLSLDSDPIDATVEDVWNISDEEIAVGITFNVYGVMECKQKEYNDEYGYYGDQTLKGPVSFRLFTTVILAHETGEFVTWELNDIEIEPDFWIPT